MPRPLRHPLFALGIAVAGLGVAIAYLGTGSGGGGDRRIPSAGPARPVSTEPNQGAISRVATPSESLTSAPGRVPALDEDAVMQGRYVFEKHCMACHGRWGDGRGELAEGMLPKPRRLTSGIFKFHSTPSGYLPTDRDLERTVRNGIANSSMPSFGQLSQRDLVAVIAYVKTLSSRWRRAESHGVAMEFEGEPEWFYDDVASRPHGERGGQLFQANCAGCHSVKTSELVDHWGDPCPAPDLGASALKCGGEATDLFRILTTGMDGTPMPSFETGLSAEDRWDLVAYLRQLRRGKKSEPEPSEGDPGEGTDGELPGSK